MNKIWEYMGKSYPFNIMRESCFVSVSRGIADLSHALRCNTVGGASLCEVIREFFDGLFGEGAGMDICRKMTIINCIHPIYGNRRIFYEEVFCTADPGQCDPDLRQFHDAHLLHLLLI